MNIIKKLLIICYLVSVSFLVNGVSNTLEDSDNNGLLEIYTSEELAFLQMDSGMGFSRLLNDGFHDGFELKNDINLSGINWIPIKEFNATFNGNNYVISNLTIDLPDQFNVGLFGSISGATIENLILHNVDIVGFSGVGALVGNSLASLTSNVSISNISIQGQVQGGSRVGGVVGDSYLTYIRAARVIGGSTVQGTTGVGSIAGFFQQGSINTSSGNAIVTSTGSETEFTGGLIGYATGCNVLRSAFIGDVNGITHVGGLIGFVRNCNIKQTYSLSKVKGNSYVGGLIGSADVSTSVSLSLSESYASGELIADTEGDSHIGGLIGINVAEMYPVIDSYFDIDHHDPSRLDDSDIYGVSTSELKCTNEINSCQLFMSWEKEVWQFGSINDYPSFLIIEGPACEFNYTLNNEGVCIKDRVDPEQCPEDQELIEGVCTDKVDEQCPDGQELIEGACTDIKTEQCPDGQELIDDTCTEILNKSGSSVDSDEVGGGAFDYAIGFLILLSLIRYRVVRFTWQYKI